MQLRERTLPREMTETGNGSSEPNGDATADRRQQASRLLSAGRAAIDRALSGDSERFIEQVKQSGGQ